MANDHTDELERLEAPMELVDFLRWQIKQAESLAHIPEMRLHIEKLRGWVRELEAAPPPQRAVSDEMVERAHAKYHQVLGHKDCSDPMRAALEAVLGGGE